jgi:flagellar biosynthesis regulator FlaF
MEIPDQVLEEQLAFARKDGFLKGVTEAEMKWVRRKIADLKEERTKADHEGEISTSTSFARSVWTRVIAIFMTRRCSHG